MMLKVACQGCGHVGIVATALPAFLQCSRCGDYRRIVRGTRLISRKAQVEERRAIKAAEDRAWARYYGEHNDQPFAATAEEQRPPA